MAEDVHYIAVAPGDLHGITTTDSTLKVFNSIPPEVLKKPLRFSRFPYGADDFLKRGITELTDKDIEELSHFSAIYLGAVGDPTKIAPGVLENGILIRMRRAFDQYVCLRPVILPPGVIGPLRNVKSEDINFEICRENTEGLYVNEGEILNKDTDDEVAIQKMKCSYKGVKRLAEFAAQRALTRPERRTNRKPRLHFIFKNNILTFAAHPWNRVYQEFKKRTDIDVMYMHIDAFHAMQIRDPGRFDVILTENMFGDIASDLGAELQGGLETAASGNINPTMLMPSTFESTHGSIPDRYYFKDVNGEYIKGTFDSVLAQTVKPEAAFRAGGMMLEHLGETEAANRVIRAALANMKDPDYKNKTLDQLTDQACRNVSNN